MRGSCFYRGAEELRNNHDEDLSQRQIGEAEFFAQDVALGLHRNVGSDDRDVASRAQKGSLESNYPATIFSLPALVADPDNRN